MKQLADRQAKQGCGHGELDLTVADAKAIRRQRQGRGEQVIRPGPQRVQYPKQQDEGECAVLGG